MITIYNARGQATEVAEESLQIWLERGWRQEAPAPTDAPAELREAVADTQGSDVTASGESEVEGVTPAPEDEE